MENAIDTMEHMLAVSLCADATASNDYHQGLGYTMPRWLDGGMATMTTEFPTRVPTMAYASSWLDGDRLFTTNHNLLLKHPSELIGDGSEIMTISGGNSTWIRLEPVHRVPRNVTVAGRAHYFAAMHVRHIEASGMQSYYSTLIPFSRAGFPLAAQWRGAWVSKPTDLGKQAILVCSMIEDAQRPNAMLASVRDSVELTFPVSEDAYLDAFALRDAPNTAQGRRRALLHWVAKHMRTTKRGRNEVKRHMRGVTEFDMGGYRVRLFSADSDAPSRAA